MKYLAILTFIIFVHSFDKTQEPGRSLIRVQDTSMLTDQKEKTSQGINDSINNIQIMTIRHTITQINTEIPIKTVKHKISQNITCSDNQIPDENNTACISCSTNQVPNSAKTACECRIGYYMNTTTNSCMTTCWHILYSTPSEDNTTCVCNTNYTLLTNFCQLQKCGLNQVISQNECVICPPLTEVVDNKCESCYRFVDYRLKWGCNQFYLNAFLPFWLLAMIICFT